MIEEPTIEDLRKGAVKGCAEDQFELGFLYDCGVSVKSNPTIAARWYRKAARQGHAMAQNNLANLYLLWIDSSL